MIASILRTTVADFLIVPDDVMCCQKLEKQAVWLMFLHVLEYFLYVHPTPYHCWALKQIRMTVS